jgi:hypothetical protein
VLGSESLITSLIEGMASHFKGDESLSGAYKSCVKHALQEHSNPFTQYMDVDGNEMGVEGWGATAITGNYNVWSRLNPVMTAGYLARARSIEMFQVIHDDKPTFWREYNVQYMQKGLEGQKLVLPKAIRAGQVKGLLDLPLIEPKASGNPNIEDIGPIDGTTVTGMIKVGTSNNLFDQSDFAKGRHALERNAAIDWVKVKIPLLNGTFHEGLIKINLERILKTGKTSERLFDDVLTIPYYNVHDTGSSTYVPDTTLSYAKAAVSAVIDLDTGDYRIMTDGTGIITHIHFKIRVTNVANEMESLMNGQDKYILTFDVENKIYGSIPVIPEMNADFNAGGEGVSWVAYMTDSMTENYSGIRDNDLEGFVEDEYQYNVEDKELSFKLGGYKYTGTFNVTPRHPGGTDDILAPVRQSLKHYLVRIFTRAEKTTNFDKNIERQWIIMGNDEDVALLPDIQWQNATAALTGGEGTNTFRYGFSLDDEYGFIDSFGRRVRVIGSKDERWMNKPLTCVLKTTTIAAPTLIYFPYMFRVFSGISPDMTNRPALLFASRDAKRCSSLIQARITLDGNDETLYQNAAAFAAGFPASGQPAT